MNLKTMFATTALCSIGAMAAAQEVGDVSAGIGLTTYGFSLEGEYIAAPQIGVRGMLIGGFNLEDEFDLEDATVDGEASFGGFALIGDYYPLSNPWRISGGLFFSTSEITGDVTEGLLTYEGEIAFTNEIAPMITTGFSTEFAPGWSLSGDLGFIISSLEVSSDDADPLVQADIDELNDDLGDIPVLPFLGFAVSYSY